ncbi:MAG: hypothetical protein IPF92_06015 [Myxococcales bacterium]|jgi:hypothetical protein|nr:hypothetical protein [Myxococcales bacterium]
MPWRRDWFFFDAAERDTVAEALEALRASSAAGYLELEAGRARLQRAAELVRDCPTLSSAWTSGGRAFGGESLIELLCRVPDYDLDLHLPTKAVLGQAYLITKINFLKALGYALDALPLSGGGREPAASPELRWRLAHEIGQSIYTKLAEEVFVSMVTSPDSEPRVKTGAAAFLFRIWEERLSIEVDDFAPLLESTWEARTKLLPVLGTLLGTHEVFQLFREARDHRFLDYFGEDDVEQEQLLAFEEFLFGISHEEITRLRAHMTAAGQGCVTLEEARDLLGHARSSWMPETQGAQALYTSYKRRRVKASYRALTETRGPKKTAEEYVMIAFLRRGATPSTFAMKVAPDKR